VKIWIIPPRIEIQVFVFARKKTELFTAKHWLSYLPSDTKTEKESS